MSECAVSFTIVCSVVNLISSFDSINHSNYTMESFMIDLDLAYGFSDGYWVYTNLVSDTGYRISNAITILSMYSVALFLRILTQYMVYQYSFYTSHKNVKFEIVLSLYCLLALFIMGFFSTFLMLFHICIVFAVFYEFIRIVIANQRLCLLLKQRLNDAIRHENQLYNVILYYRLAYRDYKYSSTVFLIAFLIQNLGLSLFCIPACSNGTNIQSYCLGEFYY